MLQKPPRESVYIPVPSPHDPRVIFSTNILIHGPKGSSGMELSNRVDNVDVMDSLLAAARVFCSLDSMKFTTDWIRYFAGK
jgi:hypothetical protein